MSVLGSFVSSGYREGTFAREDAAARWRSTPLYLVFLLPSLSVIYFLWQGTQTGFGAPAVAGSLFTLAASWMFVAVMSSVRRIAVAGVAAGLASVLALSVWGTGSNPGLWVMCAATLTVFSAVALLTTRWGRVDPVAVLLATAVTFFGVFIAAVVVTPSPTLAAIQILFGMVAVGLSVAAPRVVYVAETVRLFLSRDKDTIGWDISGPQASDDVTSERSDVASLVGEVVRALPEEFTAMWGVEVSPGYEPIDCVLVGPTGVFLLASVSSHSVPVVENKTFFLPGSDVDRVLSRVSAQRHRLSERLSVPSERVTVLVVVASPEGDSFRHAIVYRPDGSSASGEGAVLLSTDRLVDEIDTPLRGLSKERARMLAAKVAATCRPRKGGAVRFPTIPTQVGYVKEDGRIQWVLRDRASSREKVSVEPGNLVSLASYPSPDGWRITSSPKWQGQSLMVEVCRTGDYRAYTAGRKANVYAVPLTEVQPYVLESRPR